MGKLMAVAAAVAAKLTLIDSATISKKLCNSLMVMMVLLRAAVVVAAQRGVLLNLQGLQHGDRRVLQSAFKAAHVGSVDTGIGGESFL